MKVAVLSPVAWRTPPKHYGPWEQIASTIAESLIARGFDVTLFATGDSLTRGKLDAVIGRGYEEDREQDAKVVECLHISNLMEKAGDFEIIHNNYDFLPLTWSRLIPTPIVTTIHGFSSQKILAVYRKYNKTSHYVSISDSDRSPDLDYLATVYNGINPGDFAFNENPDNYLLFFGRIHPDKGTEEAIRIARSSGRKLIIAGIIQDENYFRERVEPAIDGESVVYVGPAGPEARNELLGKALALLHPIAFNEPFGMSVAESMMCGTPVIAFRRGSMPELIEHEKTGFLVSTVEEAAERVRDLSGIDRAYCRERAVNRFSAEKMVDDYVRVYKMVREEL